MKAPESFYFPGLFILIGGFIRHASLQEKQNLSCFAEAGCIFYHAKDGRYPFAFWLFSVQP
jgi:hypothetical protein